MKVPLRYGVDGSPVLNNQNYFILDANDLLIAYGQLTQNTARRIVACVNACEGIPTELLESKQQTPRDAFRRIANQRDELLEIVKDMRNSNSEVFSISPEGRTYLKKMDAAIAKAEQS